MKRTFLIIAFLMFCFAVSGQDYTVEGVEHLLGDFTAREYVKKDGKGRQCAVLRVATRGISDNEKSGFHFESDFGSQIVEKSLNNGEIWVWVSPGIKTLKIKHERLGSYEVHFIDYLHDAVQSLHTYKISIKGEVGQIKSGFGSLEMVTNPAGATIVMDGSEFPSKTPYKIPIAAGFHEVEFSKYKYKNKIESFEIEKDSTLKLVVNLELDVANITLVTDSDGKMYEITEDTIYLGTGLVKNKEYFSGPHKILTKRDMCFDTVQTIMVVGGKNEEIQLVRPRVDFAMITLRANSDVSLTLDNEYLGTGDKTKKLKSGKHIVESKCDMCFDTIQEINVVAGHNETIELARPRKNYAMITFVTDSDVQLQVDNEIIGNGQKTRKLLSGKHTVFSKRDLCIDTIQEIIVVAGKDETIELGRPKINYGNIKITTDKDAKISINGNDVTCGSYENKLECGSYKIVCKKENSYDAVRDVVLNVGDDLKLDLRPQLRTGALDVKSEPSGATVFVNNERKGFTPLKLDNIMIGQYNVRLEKTDFKSVTKNVRIEDNKTNHIDVKFESTKMLLIKTNKVGSVIYVDGKKVGFSPYKGVMTYGRHRIKAVNGKNKETKNVKINAASEYAVYLSIEEKTKFNPKGNNRLYFLTAEYCYGFYGSSYGLSFGMTNGDNTAAFMLSFLSCYKNTSYDYKYETYDHKVHDSDGIVDIKPNFTESYYLPMYTIFSVMYRISSFYIKFGIGLSATLRYVKDDNGKVYLTSYDQYHNWFFGSVGMQYVYKRLVFSLDANLSEFRVGAGVCFGGKK